MRAWLRAGTTLTAVGMGAALVLTVSTARAQNNTSEPATRTIQMVPAQAQLDKTLDAKKAKQGDAVTAKLEQAVNIPDAQALPKNTMLVGHVDAVQASDHKSNSQVTVTFDQAKLKSGQTVPIKATVMAIAEPASMEHEEASDSAAMAPRAAIPAGGAPMAAGPGGGGTAPAAAPAQPMNVPEPTTAPQGGASKQGVPGVMLQSDIHQPTSATFLSKGRNVHVPDGTQMQMAIAEIPAGVTVK